jgi:hypothetical protein
MRYFISFIFLLTSVVGHCNLPKLWFENFQNVMIESLPMNRVYLDYGNSVFSFEVPADFMNMQDTSLFCNLAKTLGFSTYRFIRPSILDEFVISNSNSTKLLQAHWEFRMCGLDLYPSQYIKDFCSERKTDGSDSFKAIQLYEQTIRNDAFTRSLMPLPYSDNPWESIPHFEYRQCFRYCQSLFVAYLKINKSSEKRFMHAEITTVVPTTYNFIHHYFEYWATEFSPKDILMLKRIMNSIRIFYNKENFRIYGEVIYENGNVTIEQGWRRSPEKVVELGKKMFRIYP